MLRVVKLSPDSLVLSSIYSIKFGTELLALASSCDSFAVGGYNGGLWGLRRKQSEGVEYALTEMEAEDQLFKSIKIQRAPEFLPRDYRYFNRGVHSKIASGDDALEISAFKGRKLSSVSKKL